MKFAAAVLPVTRINPATPAAIIDALPLNLVVTLNAYSCVFAVDSTRPDCAGQRWEKAHYSDVAYQSETRYARGNFMFLSE